MRLLDGYTQEQFEDYQILKQKHDQLLEDFANLELDFNNLQYQMDEGGKIFLEQRDRISVLEWDLEHCYSQYEHVNLEADELEEELTDVLGALSDAQDKIEELEEKLDNIQNPPALYPASYYNT